MPNNPSNIFHKMDHWDKAGCLYLNTYCHNRIVKRIFSVISRLGDGAFWYGFALLLPVLFGAKGIVVGAMMTVSGLLCLVFYRHIKTRLVRERPFIKLRAIMQGCAPLDRYSFPSGHTMHAVCFTKIIVWHFPDLWVIVVPFTLLVALSRMILGLHYPSDVICGALLGAVVGATTLSLFAYCAERL